MTTASSHLAAVRACTAALIRGLRAEQWSDADVHAPSLLPNWSRGHVLTHLARNADGIANTLSGALRGDVVARYPGGRAGRDADIENGAGRPAAQLLADVSESAQRLDRLFGAVAEADGWDLPTDQQHPASDWVLARWREVEIHRVDLGGAYTADEWPAEFVGYLLPEAVDDLNARTPSALRIIVGPSGSVTTDLGGATWNCGDGADPIDVTGPDWALLAWVLGRPAATQGALSQTPALERWT